MNEITRSGIIRDRGRNLRFVRYLSHAVEVYELNDEGREIYQGRAADLGFDALATWALSFGHGVRFDVATNGTEGP